MPGNRLLTLLRTLEASEAEFIVVGGLAAVLQGAPVQTYDVNLVYSRHRGNIERLLNVLESLDAVFRIQPERRLKPTASHLVGGGHLNLLTIYGPLDLLASIGPNLVYGDLISRSSKMKIAEGTYIDCLNLDFLIELKEQLAGDKDVAVLPVLRQTLKELRKKQGFHSE